MEWAQANLMWATILGVFLFQMMVILFVGLYLGRKSDMLRREVYHSMMDFHGRLCAIEERYHIKRHQNHL